ncbi:hypothetical protein ONZ43_g3084 [Nemania bipapillata]|uniref:Uncharacterized protein n=1 Tax=Nemania bipapillata TaxID=110536 RepID=A0ACC2IY58_9PEZI|nr:hypothetical protein ONZ43_g3084 [Nemania bipapillata]
MSTSRCLPQPAVPDLGFVQFPWGCRILVHWQTGWPVTAGIIHRSDPCDCEKEGGVRIIVRDFLLVAAFENYWKRDRRRYNAFVCDGMIAAQARRLGIEMDGLGIRDSFPQCSATFRNFRAKGRCFPRQWR